jgi:glycosyltransferase involved in cell wall biosynthesis
VLILGPVDTPHTEHLAAGARERGFEVFVGGDLWNGTPPAELRERGLDVSLRSWPTARWLGDLITRVRPDVIHANWLPNAFTYLIYGATPMVAMAWGSDVYRSGRVGRLLNRFVARYAGIVMADSEDLREQLIGLGATRERTEVLNWGIDLRAFAPGTTDRAELRRRLGLPDGRLILGPRSLRDVYSPRTIINAFERLADRHGDVQLLLKHVHEDEPDLGPLRHPERIHRVGYVPYEQMADYYRAADVCVSIPSSDSSPRSVWEAMGCGSPCVLSDLPWAHELIADERDALIVPIDPARVADAIERVLTDPELSSRIQAGARALVERHRDRESELDRLAAVYDRLARERPGTSARVRVLQSVAASAGVAIARARKLAPV